MKKILKYSAISIASLFGIAIIGIVLVVTIVNPNRFKPAIVKAVYQSTGRNITLDGDISWKIYPNLGVTVRKVTLSNPDGFDKPNFMTLNSADVSVALIPLLSNHIVVKTLAIDGLNLDLIEKKGINNWTFTPPATPPSPSEETSGGKPQPLQLEMSKFSFTQANIAYDNFDKNQHYGVKDTSLLVDTGFGGHIKFDQGQELVDLAKVSFKYNTSAVGDIDFKVTSFADPKYSGKINLSKLQLNEILDQFNIAKDQRKGIKLLDDITMNGSIDGDMNNVSVKDFAFNFSDKFKGKTTLDIKNLKKPSYSGNLDLEPFNLNQVLDLANIAVNERKGKTLLNDFSISSSGFSGDTNNISLNGLKIAFGKSVSANFGKLTVNDFAKPKFSGSMDIPTFNLNQVLDGLGIAVKERQGKTLFNEFAISSSGFNGDTNNILLNNLKVSAGKSVNASFAKIMVNNFKNPQYSISNMNVAPMNLNQVLDNLGVATKERQGKTILNNFAVSSSSISGTKNSANMTNLKLTLGELKPDFSKLSINNFASPQVNGSVSIPKFSLNNVMQQSGIEAPKIANKAVLDNIAITTAFAGSTNSINLTNMKAQVGKSNVSGNLNVSSFKPLAFNNNITIDEIDVSDFSDINGYKLPIKQLHLSGNTKIASNMDLATLNSNQSIQAGNILLQGVSVDKLVLQLNDIVNKSGQGNTGLAIALNALQATDAINKMKAQVEAYAKPGKKDLSQTTNLGTFSANATINNGNASPSSIKLNGPSLALNGSGTVNLAGKKQISYKASSQLLTTGINPIFQKLVFSSSVSGTTDNPSASIDWGSLQQQVLKYAVQQNKGQIQNAVKQQINNAVGQQIQQAVGQQTGNQAVDAVSQGVTNAIGKLFGN